MGAHHRAVALGVVDGGVATALDDVGHLDWHVVGGHQHDLADFAQAAVLFSTQEQAARLGIDACLELAGGVLPAADQPQPAHRLHRVSLAQVIAAHVGVALGQCRFQLLERDAVLLEPVGVGLHLVALHRAAEAHDVDDPLHAPKLLLQLPVVERLQIVERVNLPALRVFRVPQHVAIDFAGRRGRRDHRVNPRRQIHLVQPVEHLEAGAKIVRAVIELVAQMRQAEQRFAARVVEPRHAGQRDLQRDRHLPLDLLGRGARVLRDHLNDRRGRIGIGLDVDVQERIDAKSRQRHGRHDDDQAVDQGPSYQAVNHKSAARSNPSTSGVRASRGVCVAVKQSQRGRAKRRRRRGQGGVSPGSGRDLGLATTPSTANPQKVFRVRCFFAVQWCTASRALAVASAFSSAPSSSIVPAVTTHSPGLRASQPLACSGGVGSERT